MGLQFSVGIRNGGLDLIESIPGVSAVLRLFTGAPPANCAAANTGTVLATINLPSDWMSPASNGVKTLLGTWQDASADATGTVGHFRIHDSTLTTCHVQGTVTATGGGGDMTVDNTSFASGQQFTINTFSITAGNA
jgi:hypothetical protein